MRIVVNAPGMSAITVPFPTALLLSRTLACIAVLFVNKAFSSAGSPVRVTLAQACAVVGGLRRWRRITPDPVLVEVHAADGTQVYIRL